MGQVWGKPARVQRSEPRTALASPSRLSGPQQNRRWVTPGNKPPASLPRKGRACVAPDWLQKSRS